MLSPKVLLININDLKPPVAPIALDYLGAALEEKNIRPVLAAIMSPCSGGCGFSIMPKEVLMNAICEGYRGAYWHILSRLDR